MTATKYTRSLAADFGQHLESSLLSDSIKASSIGVTLDRIDTLEDSIDIWFSDSLSAPDESAMDSIISSHGLNIARLEKFSVVDKRTVALIHEGFSYSGNIFSLSASAQSYWNGLGNLIANKLLIEPDDFPLEVNTLDDSSTYSISGIADAIAMFATAAATVKALLASGTTIKNQVRASATIAEVDAIVDTR